MDFLPQEMTNRELKRHILRIEAYLLKIIKELSQPKNINRRGLLFAKRRLVLIRYADTIQEAANRKLLRIH